MIPNKKSTHRFFRHMKYVTLRGVCIGCFHESPKRRHRGYDASRDFNSPPKPSRVCQHEVDRLINRTDETLYPLIRSCALAVLNSGVATDDSLGLFSQYPDFDMEFERHPRGLQVTLKNAPAQAFVDGTLIETIHDQLFAVLRDLLHSRDSSLKSPRAITT